MASDMKQFTTPPWQRDSLTTATMLTVSMDGYIRLSFAELQGVHLIHLISGLDEDSPAELSGGAILLAITGYTEWVSNTLPAITIGWDWQMEVVHDHVRLCRISEPRSNIMLQDAGRLDVGTEKTVALLEAFIDALNWQVDAQMHIDTRYTRRDAL